MFSGTFHAQMGQEGTQSYRPHTHLNYCDRDFVNGEKKLIYSSPPPTDLIKISSQWKSIFHFKPEYLIILKLSQIALILLRKNIRAIPPVVSTLTLCRYFWLGRFSHWRAFPQEGKPNACWIVYVLSQGIFSFKMMPCHLSWVVITVVARC